MSAGIPATVVKEMLGEVHMRNIPHTPAVGEKFECCGKWHVVRKVEEVFNMNLEFFDRMVKVFVS